MNTEKIISAIEKYEEIFRLIGIPRSRMDTSKTFSDLSDREVLEHAHYLCRGVKEFA